MTSVCISLYYPVTIHTLDTIFLNRAISGKFVYEVGDEQCKISGYDDNAP